MAQLGGDPTVLGWCTTGAYLGAAVLCFRAAAATQQALPPLPDQPLFWRATGTLLVLLGVNKELDLQTWVLLLGRFIIESNGLYDERRFLPKVFFALVSLGVLALLGGFAWLARRVWRECGTALVGLGFLALFVVLRLAYFERMDGVVGLPLAAFRVKWVLELGGIACIAVAAWARSRSPRRLVEGRP